MRKSAVSLLLSCILVCSGQMLAAQDTLFLSAEGAVELALKQSEEITLADIEVGKARQQVREQLAVLLPQVYGSLSYTQYGKLPSTIFPNTFAQQDFLVNQQIEQAFDNLGQDVNLTNGQTIDDIPAESALQFGKKFNVNTEILATQVVFNGVFLVGIKAANTYIDLVEDNREIKKDEVADLVTRSYYNALLAKEFRQVVRNNYENLSGLLAETKALYENGFVESIDVDRLQLTINNLESRLVQSEKQVALAEAVLKFQIGLGIYDPVKLTDDLNDLVDAVDYELGEKGDFSKRIEVHLFDVRERVNEYNVKRFKFQNVPSLNFYGSMGSSAQRESFSFFNMDEPWFNTRYFGFELIVPIWDSFKGSAQSQYARLDVQRIQEERKRLFRSFDLEYERAKTDLSNARTQLENARRNMELAERIYNVVQIKYKEGIGSSLEVSDAEKELFTAQGNLLEAIQALLMASADVDKVLGNY